MDDDGRHAELDELVRNMELTLISVIQGIAVYFLTNTAGDVLVTLQWEYWPYILTGLLVICLVWSRTLVHVFTVIRWPLEFGHNFLYIACAILESVMFMQLARPSQWFGAATAYALAIWLLLLVDLRMMRRGLAASTTPAQRQLFQALIWDQTTTVRLGMPGVVAFFAVSCYALYRWPDLFLVRKGHVVLACLQLATAAVYLVYTARFFRRRIVPLIPASRAE